MKGTLIHYLVSSKTGDAKSTYFYHVTGTPEEIAQFTVVNADYIPSADKSIFPGLLVCTSPIFCGAVCNIAYSNKFGNYITVPNEELSALLATVKDPNIPQRIRERTEDKYYDMREEAILGAAKYRKRLTMDAVPNDGLPAASADNAPDMSAVDNPNGLEDFDKPE